MDVPNNEQPSYYHNSSNADRHRAYCRSPIGAKTKNDARGLGTGHVSDGSAQRSADKVMCLRRDGYPAGKALPEEPPALPPVPYGASGVLWVNQGYPLTWAHLRFLRSIHGVSLHGHTGHSPASDGWYQGGGYYQLTQNKEPCPYRCTPCRRCFQTLEEVASHIRTWSHWDRRKSSPSHDMAVPDE